MESCSKCHATCVVPRQGMMVCNQCGNTQGITRRQLEYANDQHEIREVMNTKHSMVITKDIARAAQINGWMSDLELQWLADQAKEHHLIVELGSYKGRSTRALGDCTEGVVVAVDHWKGESHLGISQQERDKLFSEFNTNLNDLIERKKVIPINVDHANINDIPMLAEINPDFVFVDGDHTQAKRDIEIWLKKLIPGGTISGHDSGYKDVAKAIAELLPNFKLVPDTTIWYALV